MLTPADVFHTGFVVTDLDEAMTQLTDQLGVRWTNVEERTLDLRGPDGSFQADMRYAYTVEGPNRIELLRSVPGTIWESQAAGNYGALSAHHLGVWCDDVAGKSAELVEAGSPLLVTYDSDPDKAVGFAYHRLSSGVILELVDSARRELFDRWYAGGEFPVGG